jgi:predicted porin
MKFKLGALALALIAPTAFAQSSVTVYGIIDLGGTYIKGAATTVRETSAGGLAGSRIGFKGTEDIGGGTYVDFVLEGGLNVDTGSSAQNGALFGRQAFGAIRNAAFGSLSAGRQYSSLYVQTGEFSAFANVTGSGPSTSVIGGYAGGYEPVQGGAAAAGTTTQTNSESQNGGPARVNNSVRYTTPVLGGFKASVLYGAGEVTGGTSGTRLIDSSIRYTNYGFDAMVSIVSDKAAGSFATSTTATSTGATVGNHVNTITATVKYTLDDLRVYAGYLKGDDKRDVAELYKHDGRGIWVGTDYRVGANLFKAQWVNNEINNNAVGAKDGKTNAFGVGYQYDLSKRTALYTSLSRFVNTGFVGNNTGRYNGSISGLTTAADHSLTEFGLGVRHSF